MSDTPKVEWASTHWEVDDVTDRYECSPEEARDWLDEHEKWLVESMIQAGWSYIEVNCPLHPKDDEEDDEQEGAGP
jgi:hypothetical protein